MKKEHTEKKNLIASSLDTTLSTTDKLKKMLGSAKYNIVIYNILILVISVIALITLCTTQFWGIGVNYSIKGESLNTLYGEKMSLSEEEQDKFAQNISVDFIFNGFSLTQSSIQQIKSIINKENSTENNFFNFDSLYLGSLNKAMEETDTATKKSLIFTLQMITSKNAENISFDQVKEEDVSSKTNNLYTSENASIPSFETAYSGYLTEKFAEQITTDETTLILSEIQDFLSSYAQEDVFNYTTYRTSLLKAANIIESDGTALTDAEIKDCIHQKLSFIMQPVAEKFPTVILVLAGIFLFNAVIWAYQVIKAIIFTIFPRPIHMYLTKIFGALPYLFLTLLPTLAFARLPIEIPFLSGAGLIFFGQTYVAAVCVVILILFSWIFYYRTKHDFDNSMLALTYAKKADHKY